MKLRYYILGTITIVLALAYRGCQPSYTNIPNTSDLDFSKKGTTYETEFIVPVNIFGSWIYFDFAVYAQRGHKEETNIESEKIRTGKDENYKPIPPEKNQYFKFKITLTPLGWASKEIEYWTPSKKRNTNTKDKIEEIVILPLYDSPDLIMSAELQQYRSYHVKIESLQDVQLPKYFKTRFEIEEGSTKH